MGELLSFFPACEVEVPVTKELLRAEMLQQLNKMLIWLMATIIGTASIAVTIVVAVILEVAA